MAGEGRTGTTGGNASDASFDVLTQTQNSTNRRITALEGEVRGRLRRRAITAPQSGSPFVIIREKTDLGELDTVQFELAPGTRFLKMVYRKTAEDATTNKEEDWELTDAEMLAGHLERRLKDPLDFGTEYGVVGLLARADVPGAVKVRNPDPFSDVTFLTTWTTDDEFTNQPSRPDLGLIFENKFNLLTKGFDAYVKIRLYAGIDDDVTTYAGTASITNNSNIVTGSITFAGVIAVGQLIIVGTRMRKVTNVAGTQITVDVPFKESASGQAVNFGNPHTWLSAQTVRAGAKFKLTSDGTALNKSFVIDSDEENEIYIDRRIDGFLAARRYAWVRNFYISALDGRNETPAVNVEFVAGNFTEATANIPELTGVGYDYDAVEPANDNQRNVISKATQPDPPVALALAELFLQIAGTGQITTSIGSPNLTGVGTFFNTELAKGKYVLVGTQVLLVKGITDDTHATISPATDIATNAAFTIAKLCDERGLRHAKFHPEPGVADRETRIHWGPIKTKKLAAQTFVTRYTADNGFTRDVPDAFTTSDASDIEQPLALAFPSAPSGSNNTVDGDPEKALARIALTLATGNGATFAANFNSQLEIVLIRRNAANSADVGNPFSEIKVLSTTDLAATSCVHEFFLGMGRKFRIIKVIARNGNKRVETTGTADFTAGGVLIVDTGDAKTVPTPVIVSVTRTDTDDNKSDDITYSLTQDGLDIVLFKKLVIERNINGSGWRGHIEVGLKTEDALYASTSGTITKTISIPRRAGKTAQYRLTAYAVGSKASATTTSGLQGATTADVAPDTGQVTLAFNPTLTFKRGKLTANQKMKNATNIVTIETVELCITDGTDSLNLEDLSSNTKVSGEVFYYLTDKGTNHVVSMSKQQLQTIFGTIAQLKCRFRFTNVFGATTSNYSSLLNSLDQQNDYSPRSGYNNELWNGDFTFDNGVSATAMGNWQQYAPSDGGFSNINTGSASARWDRDNHLYFWRVNDATSTNKRFLVQNLFQVIVPSDYKSFSFFLSSNSSLSADVDVFLASLFVLTGTVSITGGSFILTGQAGVAQFLSELRVGAEIGVNGEIHIIQSVTDNEHAVMTLAASSTGSGFSCFAAVPQSEIVSITGRTYGTSETYIEATVQVKSDLYTARDVYLCFRTPTTVNSAGPYLRVGRVMMVSGKTSVQFARKVLYERNDNSSGVDGGGAPVASENLSYVPIGGIGGDRQEGSGEPAPVGGYQVVL
jgi:hypothetical protein